MYRVSLKAIIENEQGEILCVKEKGSDWTLPGGGLDHGETIGQGLDRELHEELDFKAGTPYTFEPIGHDIVFVESKHVWQLLVLFRVTFEKMPLFIPGIDGDAVCFMHPTLFQDAKTPIQHIMYKWCVEKNRSA